MLIVSISVCVLRGAVNIMEDLLSGSWLPDSIPNHHLTRDVVGGGILAAGKMSISESVWRVDVNVRDDTGKSPLMLLAMHGVTTDDEDILSDHTASTVAVDGVSPAQLEKQLTEMLMSRKLDVCARDEEGQTVIPLAAANGRMHILEPVLRSMRSQVSSAIISFLSCSV